VRWSSYTGRILRSAQDDNTSHLPTLGGFISNEAKDLVPCRSRLTRQPSTPSDEILGFAKDAARANHSVAG